MRLQRTYIVCFFILLFSHKIFGAEPDTLRIIDIPNNLRGELPSNWKHILPKKNRAYTNYSIEQSSTGPYLRALSSATSSWLEINMNDLDVAEYQIMEWVWQVNQFPETEWEMDRSDDDFAIRIEFVYDFKGGKKNILNILRKGLFTSIFKRYPPELIVSYVWSLNVPVEKPYQSPHSKRMKIIPIESDVAMQGRWVKEKRNILDDLVLFKREKTPLVLKKIRIRSDTENVPTIAESGIKYIYLIGGEEETSDK